MRYLITFELSNPVTPNSIFDNLTQEHHHQLGKSPATTHSGLLTPEDYRYSSIYVESVDMSYQKGIYVASSSSTELGMGVIHLWKGTDRVDEKDLKKQLLQ